MKIGEITIPCYVLEDGTRVLSQRGINTAFTGSRGGGTATKDGAQNLPRFLATNDVLPFISKDLMARINNPIEYKPLHGGRSAFGYEASLLPEICEVVLDANKSGKLKNEDYAHVADVLLRGFARVGIIALVDEATGYQKDRQRDALAQILEAFIAKELQPYVPTFDAEYYQELFRLRGIEFPTGSVKRPQYFGTLTNNIIYKRLAPGVLAELKKATPKDDAGRYKDKLFQRLTSNLGYPKLKQHLGSVIAIMRLSDSWHHFMKNLDKLHPQYGITLSLPFDEYEEEKDTGIGL